MPSTNSQQTSTFRPANTPPFTEYPTATGRKHSACPDCINLNLTLEPQADTSRDGHSPRKNSVSATSNSSLHSHIQSHSHNMPTLAHPGAGTSFDRNAALVQRNEQLSDHIALIPRSALTEEGAPGKDMYRTSPILDLQSYGSLNIDIPLGAQSSVSMEVVHDGKVTKLVSRFDSYAENALSNTSQVSPTDNGCSSGVSSLRGSVSNVDTFRGPRSPRKPIPSQWHPVNNGPKLATAQRAKERGHKPGSVGGSPVEVKALRGTRSLVDISRAHGAEGQFFLTKNALAAVENDLTSPPAIRSPTKRQCASLKPAWNSPATSPLRESSRQQSAFTLRTSPTKALPNAEATSHNHRRGSSVATSDGDSVYHSAETSPVRSTTEMTPSFKSDPEVLDDDPFQFHGSRLNANNKNEQALRQSNHMAALTKAAMMAKGKPIKPRLKVEIPPLEPQPYASNKFTASPASATSSVGASSTLLSPASIGSMSRIPRVAATNGTATAATSKRAQMAKMSQKTKERQTEEHEPYGLLQSRTNPATCISYVRTVDSSVTTPELSKYRLSDPAPLHDGSTDTGGNVAVAQPTPAKAIRIASGTTNLGVYSERSVANAQKQEGSSRTLSISTVKAPSPVPDPVILDSAIIYCKKRGVSGTTLE
jgi:hypothetical protein